MATYVNDLRLKEIATGDESGTWGTSTNTNLELIGEAMGVGAEAVANASTHTITMADGATDQFRSTFLRLTGGGQACTVTLAPNTLSHTWIMRNETAAALTLTQGSGANVAIAAGQTKIVATDGAGSGAIVYEVDDLELAGDLSVGDDLTFTSDSAVITFGADGDTTLTHTDGAGLTLNSTNKIMFNDASQFIQGSSATVLSLGATDEIDLTATAIDVNGTMDVSGTLGVTGIATFTDDIIIGDGKTIGSASDVDAMTIASNGQVTFTQTLIGTALDISGDIDVDGTTNLDVVDIDGAVNMASTLAVGGEVTANAGVVVDNFTLDGTTLALSSGDMTLDIAGELIIDTDAQGAGNGIVLSDDGTIYGNIFRSDSNLNIKSVAQDKDIVFMGNDGGSAITALTLDMSAAGAATFAASVSISHSAGDSLTLTKTTTEPSLRLEGDTNKDFVITVSGELLTITQNDGATDILTLDHDTKAATFNSSVTAAGPVIAGSASVNGILKAFTADIGNGETGGINLFNSAGSDQSWFVTPGLTGQNNTSFCIRDATNDLNSMFIAAVSGQLTSNSSVDDDYGLRIKNGSSTNAYGLEIALVNGPNNTTQALLVGRTGGANRFIVFTNGNVTNVNNSYGAISDLKLKENIADAASQWDDLKAVRVRNYSLIADNESSANRIGVVAQELEASGMSGLISDSDDIDEKTRESLGTTTKSVKYSVLYMKAIKALQEAMTRIETLEAKVQTLENP